VLAGISGPPAEMRISPAERNGQFCSANALIRSLLAPVAAPVAGAFMDVMKLAHGGNDYGSRYIPSWTFGFALIALVFYVFL